MKLIRKIGLVIISIIILILLISTGDKSKKIISKIEDEFPNILNYEINTKESQLDFYFKNENGKRFRNHRNLKKWLAKRNQKLLFAMNGGMYNKDLNPQGLYIENGNKITAIDRKKNGYGNFYMKPNGILYITNDNQAQIKTTIEFIANDSIKYATQSGPMLITKGKIHPKFNEGSKNIHIRNGVGLLPNGNLLFAMSKKKINFYDFATFFKQNKCENALYLDGFVSKTYLPSKNWIEEDGNFGVIIGQIKKMIN